jgi:hypothetical protein
MVYELYHQLQSMIGIFAHFVDVFGGDSSSGEVFVLVGMDSQITITLFISSPN